MNRILSCAAVFAIAGLLQGCVFVELPSIERRGQLNLETLEPAEGFFVAAHVLVIDLQGPVTIESGRSFLGGTTGGMLVELKDRLDAARKDENLVGVLLRIDSPGGGVTASDLVYKELLKFKEDRPEIPVHALMLNMATSGGVYIAMAADEVYALPTTITGSIGVITMLPSLQGVEEKWGVGMRIIKAGEVKDLGSPWRPLSEEERLIFQELIDGMYGKFVEVVLEGREDLTREQVLEFADGRIFDGPRAAELGLVDGVKYQDEVIEELKQEAGAPNAAVVSYEYPGSNRMGNIYAKSSPPAEGIRLGSEINLLNLNMDFGGLVSENRFQYLWLP